MRRLWRTGVDGIITDRPERARAVIGRSERQAVAATMAAVSGARTDLVATTPA